MADGGRILSFEFLLRQAAKPSEELFSASPAIVNYFEFVGYAIHAANANVGDGVFFYSIYTSFQSTNPFPFSSSSMARAVTLRLSALKGSAYCLALICSVAASMPPLLLSFSSKT